MVHIIGRGLAGCEAAWQAVGCGVPVTLHEMRPVRATAIHKTDRLAELICSNLLRDDNNAVGLLKEKMRRLGSLVMREADVTAVTQPPPVIASRREELPAMPADPAMYPLIVTTGTPTSGRFLADIVRLVGAEQRDQPDHAARGAQPFDDLPRVPLGRQPSPPYSRWCDGAERRGVRDDGEDDYLHCPLTQEEYEWLVDSIATAESAIVHDRYRETFFEACLPIKVMAHRRVTRSASAP